jgi:prohibitin 1
VPLVRLSLAALACACGCATVPSGYAGVLVTTRGVQPAPLGEGMHVLPPLAQVDLYDLRGQERDEDLTAIASDGASVEARTSLVTYHVAPESIPALDREVGPNYYGVVIRPIVRATVRLLIAGYTSGQLYDTELVRELQRRVTERAAERVRPFHVILDGIELRTIAVTNAPGLDHEILDEGALEQRVLATPQRLQIARSRGDARREDADAIARALERIAPTLTPSVLADEARRASDRLLTAPSTSVIVGAPDNPTLEIEP